MTVARDIMTGGAQCVGSLESVFDAAARMAELQVGALPVCGQDNRLKGMITDRDIVVKVIAAGKDPRSVRAGDLAQGEAVTISVDDHVADLLATMARYKVRRLPVIDRGELVGIVALADVARTLDDPEIGLVLAAISEEPVPRPPG